MNITIKKIGYKVGTVGWLAAGLQSGAVAISEGTLRDNGHHGLWLETTINDKPFSQFLAAYDQYSVGDREPSLRDYRPVGDEYRGTIWTNAAWTTLEAIAQDWCIACNEERAADEPRDMKAVRVAVGL